MRPQIITAGPLATADNDGVSASQKAAGAQYLVINGALSDVAATAVCASQSAAGAGALTIDGTQASGGVAYLGRMRRVYITSAGDDSGRTFTITGTGMSIGPNPIPFAVVETVTGADTSSVSTSAQFFTVTSITISGASASTLTVGMSGLATLDVARRVIITSGGNDTAISFSLAGTDWQGLPISETITGANAGAASSVLDYKTVTSIASSAAVATTVIVGTNGVAGSPWAMFDPWSLSEVVGQCKVSGTVNYTVQQTLDDPSATNGAVARSSIVWASSGDSNVVAATGSFMTTFGYAPRYVRVLLNSSTGAGYVTGTFNQFGSAAD